jgi:hypothetical protein
MFKTLAPIPTRLIIGDQIQEPRKRGITKVPPQNIPSIAIPPPEKLRTAPQSPKIAMIKPVPLNPTYEVSKPCRSQKKSVEVPKQKEVKPSARSSNANSVTFTIIMKNGNKTSRPYDVFMDTSRHFRSEKRFTDAVHQQLKRVYDIDMHGYEVVKISMKVMTPYGQIRYVEFDDELVKNGNFKDYTELVYEYE